MSGGNDIILSLDKVTCSVFFLRESKHEEYAEEKQRTLRLLRLKDQPRDQCLLEIRKKKKEISLSQVVTFCGILRDTQSFKHKKKLETRQCITLIFTDVTALILNTNLRDNQMYEYCKEKCQHAFAHVTTVCVNLHNYPPERSSYFKNTTQVLIGLTRSRFTLISAREPHVSIFCWHLDQIYAEKKGETLHVTVAGEGSFQFVVKHDQSKLSIIYTSILEFRECDANYQRVLHDSPSQASDDTNYLVPIQAMPLCEICKSLYLSCNTGEMPKTITEGDTYDIDLNEYVQMNRDWYEKLIRSFGDIGDGYITTCTYKGNTIRRLGEDKKHSEKDRERKYLTLLDPKPTTSTIDDQYLTTRPVESTTSTIDDQYLTTRPVERKEEETTSRCDHLQKRSTMPCKPSEPEAADQNTRLQFSFSDPGQHTSYTFELNKTLKDALCNKPLPKDTLGLSFDVRFQVGIKLYMRSSISLGTTMEDWQIVGEKIGLTIEAINLISIIVKNHSLPYPAAELVLRHWQLVYNKYGVTDTCPYACTKEGLISILKEIERDDIIEIIQNKKS